MHSLHTCTTFPTNKSLSPSSVPPSMPWGQTATSRISPTMPQSFQAGFLVAQLRDERNGELRVPHFLIPWFRPSSSGSTSTSSYILCFSMPSQIQVPVLPTSAPLPLSGLKLPYGFRFWSDAIYKPPADGRNLLMLRKKPLKCLTQTMAIHTRTIQTDWSLHKRIVGIPTCFGWI